MGLIELVILNFAHMKLQKRYLTAHQISRLGMSQHSMAIFYLMNITHMQMFEEPYTHYAI